VIEVVFARSGITVAWNPALCSLLELAETHGLTLPQQCRNGGCNTCMTRLVAGQVTYERDFLIRPEPDRVLLCSARPCSRRVVVDA
jgi:ferredoxin